MRSHRWDEKVIRRLSEGDGKGGKKRERREQRKKRSGG